MRRCLVWCILSPLVAWYERKHIRDIKDLKGTPLRSIWTNSLLTSDFVTKLCESFGPFEFQCTGTTCKVYMVYGSFASVWSIEGKASHCLVVVFLYWRVDQRDVIEAFQVTLVCACTHTHKDKLPCEEIPMPFASEQNLWECYWRGGCYSNMRSQL